MNKLLFIAATHGNETIGIEALEEIEDMYDPTTYNYGWIIGNPRALEAGVRFIDTDLNRSAPGDLNSEHYEERRAAEIVELSKQYNMVVDIHSTTANCGLVKIIPYPVIENIALAKSISISRNVVWYSDQSIERAPLVQHTYCPAIEIECGPKDNQAIKGKLVEVIGSILMANISIEDTPVVQQDFYEVYGVDQNGIYEDFKPVTRESETFYPFLSYQYDSASCQKLRQVNPEEVTIKNG